MMRSEGLDGEVCRAVLAGTPDGIVSVDGSHRVVLFNAAAERMFGYRAAEIVGADLGVLIPEALRDAHRRHIEQYAAHGAARGAIERARMIARRKDGTMFPIEASISRVSHDQQLLLTAFVRDVTQQEQLERELQRMQRVEGAALLATSVVHDVNGLLTVIRHAADRLHLAGGHATSEEVEAIDDAVRHGTLLTRRLLLHARPHVEPCTPVVLDEVMTGLSSLATNLCAGVQLSLDLGAGHALVRIDPLRLEHAILNCVGNARDARPSRVAIRTTRVVVDDAEWAQVTIEDDGTGIPPASVPRIFEAFYTTKPPALGTGLGLWSARASLRDAGGSITLASELGSGTQVTIRLPVATAVRARAKTILLVEDDDRVRAAFTQVLEEAGYEVAVAADAVAAVDHLEGGPPIDLLITDVVMPGMMGPQLAALALQTRPTLPVLLVSGQLDPVCVARTTGGRTASLEKPFAAAELLGTVERLLSPVSRGP